MFIRIKYIFIILLMFSLIGCSAIVENNAENGKINEHFVENHTSATEIYNTNSFDIEESCIVVSDSSANQITGKIVLQDEITNKIMILDLESNKKIELDKAKKGLAISPDNKLLAYSEDMTGDLVIIDSEGDVRNRISVPSNWIGVVNWISQDELVINEFTDQSYQLASAVVFDLNNKTSIIYESNYPNITNSFPLLQGGNNRYIRSIYNHEFTQVLYFGKEEDILWDLNENKEIEKFNSINDVYRGGAPQWSKSDEYLYVSIFPNYIDESDNEKMYFEEEYPYYGGYELFRVDKMGGVERITYFTTEFIAGEEAFSLSSSEKVIAFWLNKNYDIVDNNPKRELIILDLDTRKIINYCIESSSEPYQPKWSSDDKYLALTRYLPNSSTLSDVILLDMYNDSATVIYENAVVIGWINE